MRLLHAWANHEWNGVHRRGPYRFGRRDPRVDEREHLPLRRLRQHPAARRLQRSLPRLFGQLAERNDELAERGAVIRDLVYALSHDLRTPLAALGMMLRQAETGAYGALPRAYRDVVRRSVVATG